MLFVYLDLFSDSHMTKMNVYKTLLTEFKLLKGINCFKLSLLLFKICEAGILFNINYLLWIKLLLRLLFTIKSRVLLCVFVNLVYLCDICYFEYLSSYANLMSDVKYINTDSCMVINIVFVISNNKPLCLHHSGYCTLWDILVSHFRSPATRTIRGHFSCQMECWKDIVWYCIRTLLVSKCSYFKYFRVIYIITYYICYVKKCEPIN